MKGSDCMFGAIIGTIIFVVFAIIEKVDETEKDRLQKEYDNIDWNEYYANI